MESTPAGELSIGALAQRSGISVSALRFYDERGLLHPSRRSGGQRRYPRVALRRVAFIRAAQQVGLSLIEIQAALAGLPEGRTPTRADWQQLSRLWRSRLDDQIVALERLRDELTGCISCGCLSLRRCRLNNPDDVAAVLGAGSRLQRGGAEDVSRFGEAVRPFTRG